MPTARFPWLTFSLILMNGILFFVGFLTGGNLLNPEVPHLLRWGANAGLLVMQGQGWRLLTGTFLHVGLLHLLFNMAALWSIGDTLERLLGRTGLAVTYLLAGVAGNLLSILWNPQVIGAGASGAIFGLFGAFLGLLVQDSQGLPKPVRNRLALNALLFIAFNLMYALRTPGIDNAAHLGGLAAGWFCGLALALPATPAGLARRPGRNALVLAGGLLLAGTTIVLLPRFCGAAGALVLAGRWETRALAAYNASAAKVRQGKASQTEFADVLEREVLPDFREARARLESIGVSRDCNPEQVRLMVQLTRAREQAYTHLVEALRAGNQERASAALDEQALAYRQFTEALEHLSR